MSYNWTSTLQQGDQESDVEEVQIRVAGYAADSPAQTHVTVDGIFDSASGAAVKRFQESYGIGVDGIVESERYAVFENLVECDDFTSRFNYLEFYSQDGSMFSGGKVGSGGKRSAIYAQTGSRMSKTRGNPIIINSAFRSISYNQSVGGTSNSMYTYDVAVDIASSASHLLARLIWKLRQMVLAELLIT